MAGASTRQSANATADGSTGTGPTGRGSDAEAKQSSERTAADNLTLPACISRIVPRKGVTWAVSKYDPETNKASANKESYMDLRFMSVSLLVSDGGR